MTAPTRLAGRAPLGLTPTALGDIDVPDSRGLRLPVRPADGRDRAALAEGVATPLLRATLRPTTNGGRALGARATRAGVLRRRRAALAPTRARGLRHSVCPPLARSTPTLLRHDRFSCGAFRAPTLLGGCLVAHVAAHERLAATTGHLATMRLHRVPAVLGELARLAVATEAALHPRHGLSLRGAPALLPAREPTTGCALRFLLRGHSCLTDDEHALTRDCLLLQSTGTIFDRNDFLFARPCERRDAATGCVPFFRKARMAAR